MPAFDAIATLVGIGFQKFAARLVVNRESSAMVIGGLSVRISKINITPGPERGVTLRGANKLEGVPLTRVLPGLGPKESLRCASSCAVN